MLTFLNMIGYFPESKLIVLAIAIGCPDNQALVNNVERTHEPADVFTHWHGV